MNKIKKVRENRKNIKIYRSIKEAAKEIETTLDLWKVELIIAQAILTKRYAFKNKWYEVID